MEGFSVRPLLYGLCYTDLSRHGPIHYFFRLSDLITKKVPAAAVSRSAALITGERTPR